MKKQNLDLSLTGECNKSSCFWSILLTTSICEFNFLWRFTKKVNNHFHPLYHLPPIELNSILSGENNYLSAWLRTGVWVIILKETPEFHHPLYWNPKGSKSLNFHSPYISKSLKSQSWMLRPWKPKSQNLHTHCIQGRGYEGEQ
jgi:hypothetical protein